MKRAFHLLALSSLTFLSLSLLAWVPAQLGAITAGTASAAAQGPRNITVLVGAGQDTTEVFAYFPMTVRVRVGDTVTWRLNNDELNTVSFTAGASSP